MNAKPSKHEHTRATDGVFCAADGQNCTADGAFCTVDEQIEVSRMEYTKSQELIRRLKEVKALNEITFPRIIDRIEKNGKTVSLTTLRRVFADGSENNANAFNYELTLLPIAEALLDVEDVPTLENSPYSKEIDGLKAVIHTQNEEIARLHELKEHLEGRITFLLEQIEKKDRRMDEKDEIIRRMMEKLI